MKTGNKIRFNSKRRRWRSNVSVSNIMRWYMSRGSYHSKLIQSLLFDQLDTFYWFILILLTLSLCSVSIGCFSSQYVRILFRDKKG